MKSKVHDNSVNNNVFSQQLGTYLYRQPIHKHTLTLIHRHSPTSSSLPRYRHHRGDREEMDRIVELRGEKGGNYGENKRHKKDQERKEKGKRRRKTTVVQE